MSNFPEHFGEIIGLLLILTESHAAEPTLWHDVVQALTASSPDGSKMSTSQFDDAVAVGFCAAQQFVRLEEVVDVWQLVACHFEKERQTVGLHGLYTKYKDYSDPLAKLLLLLGRLLVNLHLREDRGSQADARKC